MTRPPIPAAEARRARHAANVWASAETSRLTEALRTIEQEAANALANATPETAMEALEAIRRRAREQR